MPPMTARARGTMASLPGKRSKAKGSMEATRVKVVMRMGRTRMRAAVKGGLEGGHAGAELLVGELDEEDAVVDDDTDEHEGAHERLNVQVGVR